MVLPEGTRDENRRPHSSRSGLIVLAGATVAIGVVAIGALTSPDPAPPTVPVAVPGATTSTTIERPSGLVDVATFDVTDISDGEQPAWELTLPLDFKRTISLVDYENWLYVFADATPTWADVRGGLVGWRSIDGVEWEPLGTVIGREAEIGQVASTERGLVATSMTGTPNGLDIWISEDGFEWVRHQLLRPEVSENAFVFANAVYGDEEKLVVTAALEFDVRALLERQLRENGIAIDLSRNYGWGAEEITDDVLFTVYGPLGIVVHQATATELDMTESEAQLAVSGFSQSSETLVWVSHGGGEWVESSIPGSPWVNDIVGTTDGELLAFGFGTRGPTVWRSFDGISWVESGLVLSPRSAERWGDRLIGPSDASPWVMVSEDGASWAQTNLSQHFPAPISWHIPELAAGEGGVLAVVEGWAQTTQLDPGRPTSPTITREGTTLTMNFDQGVFGVATGDQAYAWSMYQGNIAKEGMTVDLANGTVAFSDPESGEPLIGVTFEELQNSEEVYWLGRWDERNFRAFAFSEDGENWSIQDPEDILGEGPRVRDVAVLADRIVAVVERLSGALDPDATLSSSEVWAAPIP